jgi:hypothetical protein
LEGKGFGAWLRGLPMLPEGSPVLLYTGKPKSSQWNYLAVVDLDIGTSDLQQCADSIMRVRAKYLWSLGRAIQIKQLSANPKHWDGGDWKAYRRYRNGVMAKTGTLTMAARMKKATTGHWLQPGEVVVQGGSPGMR